MNSGRITDWPQYLLVNVPEDLRQAISTESRSELIAVSDVVRTILCARYRLHCPPESYRYELGKDMGSRNMLLRLPPKLFRALDREAKKPGKTKRSIILEALEAHYEKGES
jgi:hypothetical protein